MNTIILALVLFLYLVHYIIIIDVILSWLSLFGLRFRPRFIAQFIDPIYTIIRKYIPTTIGMFDLTPIIALLVTLVFHSLLLSIFPEVSDIISSIASR
ncbi:YggT family protein [Candidatus Gracilibacteria bacterium]|nr:YggT family protein [Candidatus Gracilibacteria bacterium]